MGKEVYDEVIYSGRGPINLDEISIDDTNLAIVQFASGSRGLEKCLRIMWQHGLKTHSCYSGGKNVFDVGYIVMEENEDVFCYLSEKFLSNDGIRIDVENNRQVFKFLGSENEKSSEMILLAQDILSGKKYNNELVKEKIGKSFYDSWVRKLEYYTANSESTYWSEKIYIKKK